MTTDALTVFPTVVLCVFVFVRKMAFVGFRWALQRLPPCAADCDSRSSRTPPNSLSSDSGASVAAGAEHPAAQQSIIKASAAAAALFRMVPRSIRLITPLLRNRREREQV